MVATYKKPMPMFVKGEGCYLYDVENRKYLDFTAGIAVNSLGHGDKAFVKVIAQQVNAPAPFLASPFMDCVLWSKEASRIFSCCPRVASFDTCLLCQYENEQERHANGS